MEAGELVVFAVESVDGQAGPRRFVLAAGPGEAVFGVPPTARLELVGTGNLGTQVRSMPVVELHASANEEAAALLAGWAGRLTAGVARYDRTTAGSESGSEAGPAPLDETAADASIPDSAAFGTAALNRLRAHLLAAEANEAVRMAATLRRDEELSGEAVRTLAAVLEGPDAEGVIGSNQPLLAACRAVAAPLGVTIVEPEHALAPVLKSAMRQIAKASQMRVRRVLLEDGWFPAEAGPLLATMRDDGRPVALTQTGTRRVPWSSTTHGGSVGRWTRRRPRGWLLRRTRCTRPGRRCRSLVGTSCRWRCAAPAVTWRGSRCSGSRRPCWPCSRRSPPRSCSTRSFPRRRGSGCWC